MVYHYPEYFKKHKFIEGLIDLNRQETSRSHPMIWQRNEFV
jgi:hypothetical protein